MERGFGQAGEAVAHAFLCRCTCSYNVADRLRARLCTGRHAHGESLTLRESILDRRTAWIELPLG